jgi:KDO2-lipid IV(A) lauroyltransferase
MTGAATLLAWGERLRWGRGYVVHVLPVPDVQGIDGATALEALNNTLENLVLQHSDQYLWGYARYKQPRAD